MLASYLRNQIVREHHNDPELINEHLAAKPVHTSGHVIPRLIGIGAFGAVFLLQHPEKPELALKIGASRQEIEIHKELSENNLRVPQIHYSEDETLVMDLFRTDFEVMHAVDPRCHDALFGLEMVNILQPIHDLGIVHCDPSPANAFVSNAHKPKLTVALGDWGLAKRLVDIRDEKTGVVAGNPCISHRAEMDVKYERIDDLWGVFYSMCTMNPTGMRVFDDIAMEMFSRKFVDLKHSELAELKLCLLQQHLDELPAYLKEIAASLLKFSGNDSDYAELYDKLKTVLSEECEQIESRKARKRKARGDEQLQSDAIVSTEKRLQRPKKRVKSGKNPLMVLIANLQKFGAVMWERFYEFMRDFCCKLQGSAAADRDQSWFGSIMVDIDGTGALYEVTDRIVIPGNAHDEAKVWE